MPILAISDRCQSVTVGAGIFRPGRFHKPSLRRMPAVIKQIFRSVASADAGRARHAARVNVAGPWRRASNQRGVRPSPGAAMLRTDGLGSIGKRHRCFSVVVTTNTCGQSRSTPINQLTSGES